MEQTETCLPVGRNFHLNAAQLNKDYVPPVDLFPQPLYCKFVSMLS